MEYLVTYGWAILVIAIVIAALFALGVFNNQSTPTVCLFPSDFGCLNSFVYANGGLSINIQQTYSPQINITAIGCNTNKTTQDMLKVSPQITLNAGANASIDGNLTQALKCYSGGNAYTSPVGTTFHGFIMLNYTNTQTGLKYTVVGQLTQRIEGSNQT